MNRVIAWSQLSVLFLGLLPACGSDGGSSGSAPANVIASCVSWCNKEGSCGTTIPAAGEDCSGFCNTESNHVSSSCDYAKLKTQLDTCASDSCADIDTCSAQIGAICPLTSGTGGSTSNGSGGAFTGSGGATTGTGGSGTGTADCSACAKAPACCAGVAAKSGQSASSCSAFSQSSCEAMGAQAGTLANLCASIVSGGAAQQISGCE